ncbi:hypothetical protein [uncultured Methylobacterium sp.]|uniref:phage adaptor protein n=1 Tax=uncultured Methylobacterium sp. TaxID=157278 RepID=UPI002617FDAA|nr:hypothetical protein [uncultured Methylobacterium sp.]
MIIASYSDLLAEVVSYLERPDLAAAVPGFVQRAEARFNRRLRTRDMEALTTLPETGALPADFLEWIFLTWTGGGRIQAPRYVEADSPEFRYKHRPHGDPQYFALIAGRIQVRPARPGSLDLAYYQAVPALGATRASNWLLARNADLYLYAALAEAHLFQKDEARAREWTKMADDLMAGLMGQADSQKTGRRPTRAAADVAEVTAANAPA